MDGEKQIDNASIEAKETQEIQEAKETQELKDEKVVLTSREQLITTYRSGYFDGYICGMYIAGKTVDEICDETGFDKAYVESQVAEMPKEEESTEK